MHRFNISLKTSLGKNIALVVEEISRLLLPDAAFIAFKYQIQLHNYIIKYGFDVDVHYMYRSFATVESYIIN